MPSTSISQKSYLLFNSKLREVIRILFDARNEDMPAHRIREDARIQPESLELLKSLNLLSEEDGYLSLDVDLIEFLERTFNISEVVSTGRINELSNDSQNLYNIYDSLDSDDARRSATRRIRKFTDTIIADLRTTQRDVRRLINQEFRFETSLHLKLQQLETYQQKSEDFIHALQLCQRRFDDTETSLAAAHPILRSTRKRFQKQLRAARKASAAIASEILDYIHRAREDKTYLNKLARICDLIERQEYESKSDLNDVIDSGVLSRLSRAEPIRTLLPSDLDGDEHLLLRLTERAKTFGIVESSSEAPILEDEDSEDQSIHIPDIPRILDAFTGYHRGRDLFTFLFEEPTEFPDDSHLEERLLETFCLILTTEKSMVLYASDSLGQYKGTVRNYHYMRVFAEKVENSRLRNEVHSETLTVV